MTSVLENQTVSAEASSKAPKSPSFEERKKFKVGTFKGVFLPSFLQMIGVILFLRLGWILGHVGLLSMFFIITLSSSLLVVTSLSMTSIVSNMKMGSGGSYYIISRLLGVAFGSAIGILLMVGQHASVALCVSGFVLSLLELWPLASPLLLKVATVFVLALISYLSTNLALRTQILIFVVLIISLISIFFGSSSNLPETFQPKSPFALLSFWIAFSMFFPATTGIDSGMAMSGDLKKPSYSLPLGTLGAVVLAYLLYLGMALFLSLQVSSDLLKSYPYIVFSLSKIPFLVTLGLWGATLSSALGSILGAPRIMQSIAKDGTLPKFLAKGSGVSNQPRTAVVTVFILSLILTLFTSIDQIIPMMTMISLTTYGLINFVAFFEEFIQNPSWRPTFRTHWALSLSGALGCFMAMFMINPGATFLVSFLTLVLCFWTSKRQVKDNFEDIRYSLFSYLIHKGVLKLSLLKKNAKSWRPYILAIFDQAADKNLVFFSHCLNQKKGFLVCGFCPTAKPDLKPLKLNFQKTLEAYGVPCYVHVNPASQFLAGAAELIKNYGFGPVGPNTVVLGLVPEIYQQEAFGKMLFEALSFRKNLLLLKELDFSFPEDRAPKKKQINLWWKGQYRGNFELCLALARIMQNSPSWNQSRICIKTVVKTPEEQLKISSFFIRHQKKLRIKELVFHPIVDAEKVFFSNLLSSSLDADLTFIGLRRPQESETLEEYRSYYLKVFEGTKDLKNIVFVLTGEKIKFEKIFT
ncbi:MAG: amino acid permease [Parachlamydiales bacterium]|jgi:amino acid transporter